MKKQYANPQIDYVFMDKDVITTSNTNALAEVDWADDGLDIER